MIFTINSKRKFFLCIVHNITECIFYLAFTYENLINIKGA